MEYCTYLLLVKYNSGIATEESVQCEQYSILVPVCGFTVRENTENVTKPK